MTKPARDRNLRWAGFLLAALVAALVTVFGAGTASAAVVAQTRAGAHSVGPQVVLRPPGGIDADRRLLSSTSTCDSVLATGGAAENPVAAAPGVAIESNYDVVASNYDASVRCVDARTVAQVDAVGCHATAVSLRRHVGAASEGSVAVSGSGAAAKAGTAIVDAGKFDYMFGRVASNAHNAARSAQNAQQLARVGVYDNSAGRALLQSHLDGVAGDASSIARSYSNNFGSFQVRDSLFSGPGGFLKFESTWQVADDGLRLTTVIPMGGP